MCALRMSVRLPQAPGACQWLDVCHLLCLDREMSFTEYASMLTWKSVPLDADDVAPCSGQRLIQKEWRSATFHPRNDEEGMVRPIIHSMLVSAAFSAEEATGGQREFLVTAEPSVVDGREDRLSDEAIIEVVSERGFFRILLEVKKSAEVSRGFSVDHELPFCHMLQQVGLALASGKWQKSILCGLATRKEWFLFKVVDMPTTNGCMVLNIVDSYYILLKDPKVTNKYVKACLSFITKELCAPL